MFLEKCSRWNLNHKITKFSLMRSKWLATESTAHALSYRQGKQTFIKENETKISV